MSFKFSKYYLYNLNSIFQLSFIWQVEYKAIMLEQTVD